MVKIGNLMQLLILPDLAGFAVAERRVLLDLRFVLPPL
jgi:hypothetical protein